MMWQMWTAFGIMLGYVSDLAFFKVPDKPHIKGLNWRLMLSSVPTSFHFSASVRTDAHSRPVYLHSSSWHKSFSVLNRPVGSCQRADTPTRTNRWSGSAVIPSKLLGISIVCPSLFVSHNLSSSIRYPCPPRGGEGAYSWTQSLS
jgi:hypothetical protein